MRPKKKRVESKTEHSSILSAKSTTNKPHTYYDKTDHLKTRRKPGEGREKQTKFKSIFIPENRAPRLAITSVLFLEHSTSATVIQCL